jgi:hypothetical protein
MGRRGILSAGQTALTTWVRLLAVECQQIVATEAKLLLLRNPVSASLREKGIKSRENRALYK